MVVAAEEEEGNRRGGQEELDRRRDGSHRAFGGGASCLSMSQSRYDNAAACGFIGALVHGLGASRSVGRSVVLQSHSIV